MMMMRRFIIFYLLPVFCCEAVNNLRALTESLGQEVIEMDAPIKELPPELDEEPSAENDSDLKSVTTTPAPSTKAAASKDARRKMKETEQTRSNQEEDEARIEKELSDLYKDSADYKADSGEVSRQSDSTMVTSSSATTEEEFKPIERARQEFKFQPDTNNRADVERFRTSVDVISCDRNRLTGTPSPLSSGHRLTSAAAVLITSIQIFFYLV